MKPKILQTQADHAAALQRVEALMDAAAGSAAEAELELWTLLIENYESKHNPILPPDHGLFPGEEKSLKLSRIILC